MVNLQGGDLYDALHAGKERLEWKAGGCRLAAQIALGLSKLHARKVNVSTSSADPLLAVHVRAPHRHTCVHVFCTTKVYQECLDSAAT